MSFDAKKVAWSFKKVVPNVDKRGLE